MMFADWQSFVAMGGHGLYVWTAYGGAGALLILNLLKLRVDRRKTVALLRTQIGTADDASPTP